MKNKKLMIMLGIVIVLIIVTVIIWLKPGFPGSKEFFASERAYRTAIDHKYLDYIEYTDPILIDPPGVIDESLRTEAMNAFYLINDERKSAGLKEFMWDARLAEDAGTRMEDLISNLDNNHTLPNGQDWFMIDPEVLLGENIYKGKKSADKVVPALMKNKPDKDNFLCDYFTKTGIAVGVDGNGEYYWAFVFGADTISVSFTDEVQPGSVWVIQDTERNRGTSIWGTAQMTPEEAGQECLSGIPKSEDDKYLLRMIDNDGLYYDAEIPELKDGWKLRFYKSDTVTNDSDFCLEIRNENGDIVQEITVFCAAL